ncbi:MAG TPA: hypothetical protein VFU59_08200 [Candidatus Eisenbacteria bacterium]|nr:hypothetical protein [Candidatus Eisenbacteria bacterium]
MDSNSTAGVSAGTTGEVPPAIRVLRVLVGLVQLAAMVMIAAPGLASVVWRQFGVEAPLSEGWVRVAGIVTFVLTVVARILLPGGGRRYRAERAFSELASATGGTFQLERRRLDKSGWAGGPTARWTMQESPVTLGTVSQSQRSSGTRVSATFTTAKELRFSVLPKNLLTGMLTSPKFVALVQSGMKQPDNELSSAERDRALREVAIFAGSPVTLGDSELDAKIIVKSNDADLARYVLAGGGVMERMRALQGKRKAWTMSLFSADAAGAAQLIVDLPGTETNPGTLRAALELVEAMLGSLSRNGVIATGRRDFPRSAAG